MPRMHLDHPVGSCWISFCTACEKAFLAKPQSCGPAFSCKPSPRGGRLSFCNGMLKWVMQSLSYNNVTFIPWYTHSTLLPTPAPLPQMAAAAASRALGTYGSSNSNVGPGRTLWPRGFMVAREGAARVAVHNAPEETAPVEQYAVAGTVSATPFERFISFGWPIGIETLVQGAILSVVVSSQSL